MPKETHHYSNEDITVIWKPKVCIHSKLCWQGLLEVFNPNERPWIKMEGAATEKIKAQVNKCPSGALSYIANEEKENTVQGSKSEEQKDLFTIKVSSGGPYLVTTGCVVVNHDGKEEIKEGTVALCRCGASKNKPYCDGSHRAVSFED